MDNVVRKFKVAERKNRRLSDGILAKFRVVHINEAIEEGSHSVSNLQNGENLQNGDSLY